MCASQTSTWDLNPWQGASDRGIGTCAISALGADRHRKRRCQVQSSVLADALEKKHFRNKSWACARSLRPMFHRQWNIAHPYRGASGHDHWSKRVMVTILWFQYQFSSFASISANPCVEYKLNCGIELRLLHGYFKFRLRLIDWLSWVLMWLFQTKLKFITHTK